MHKLSTFYELAKADLRTKELLRIQIGFTTFSHVGGMEQWQQELALHDHAVEKIKQRLAAEKREGQGLRVKVVGGGCSGLQNKLDFDTSRAGDKVFEIED